MIAVGDRVRVRTDGGSAAAREYGGREGRVTTITLSWDKVSLFVRIQANRNFGTAFEERDLVRLGDDEEVWHLGAGEGNRRLYTD